MQLLMETASKCVVGVESIQQGLVETQTRLFSYGYGSSVLEYHTIRGLYFVWKHIITQVRWIIFKNLFNYPGYVSFNIIVNYSCSSFLWQQMIPASYECRGWTIERRWKRKLLSIEAQTIAYRGWDCLDLSSLQY